AKSGNVLDNGILKLKINSDGTLSVYDYETKTLHDNINSFTDTGCSGDFWVHREPFMNQTISSKGFSTKISLVRNSFLKATYEIETKMEIPKSLNHNKEKRSSENTDLTIKTAVTLYANSKRVDFKTSILNMANEHMVCVNLPLNVMTNYAMAEAPFEIRKRDIGDITNINGKCGDELRRFTIENFVDISDDDKGVTLITKGLKEVEVIKEERVTINLTLLRSVSGTFPIHNDLFIGFENETSQCIGEHVFEYALFFHKKEENLQNVMKESKSYTAPLLSAEVGSGNGGTLPNITSFFKINTAAVNMNCMKLSEDKNGIIIRLNNPTAITKKCEISFLKNIKNAAKVKMNEEKICDLEIINNGLNLEIIPYKIETIYVEFS
ncbi:MAG: glycoside hydrolase family 38 C-terminal domain-containing protein, partial [Oscillospiraceae bacterium]